MGVSHVAQYIVALMVLCAAFHACSSSAIERTITRSHGPLRQASRIYKHEAVITKIRSHTPQIHVPPHNNNNSNDSPTAAPIPSNNNTLKIELCLDCIGFMQSNLQNLVEIVAKIGVADTCQKICGQLNSTLDVDMCNALCTQIGVEKFWQLFVSAGINPIYACELLDACQASTTPAVTISPASDITPESGPPGTTFNFNVQFTVVNETGVGETAFVVYYPSGDDHELGFISQTVFADYTPGEYVANLSFPTNASFNGGKYLVVFDLCSGACGQDPDPYPFASQEFTFNITGFGPL